MDKLNEAIKNITPPATEIILQGAYQKMQNRPSMIKTIACKFAKASLITAAAACMLLVAFFVPRMFEHYDTDPLGVAVWQLIPISDEYFTLDTSPENLQGILVVSNGISRTETSPTIRVRENGRIVTQNPRNLRRYGAINMDGEVVIPIEFMSLFPIFGDGLTIATKEEDGVFQQIYIDMEGNPFILDFNGLPSLFMDGYATVRVSDHYNGIFESFVINRQGEIAFKEEGIIIENLGNGLISKSCTAFHMWDGESERRAWVEDIYGNVLFEKDLLIIPTWLVPQQRTTTTFYAITHGRWDERYWGLFCLEANEIITDMDFLFPTVFRGNRAITWRVDGDIFVIDNKGNDIKNLTRFFYPKEICLMSFTGFTGDVVAVHFTDDTSPVIINLYGEIIAQTDFDFVSMFNNEGIAVFRKNGLYGYVNAQGEVLLPAEFEFASMMYDDVGFLRRNGQQYRFVKK
ncbi:MAG: WG repeat-containing protein [Defluviitaleaceae bacterium]|nr:WG repeat-containing protein [Defluviitaleaceae bacterium]